MVSHVGREQRTECGRTAANIEQRAGTAPGQLADDPSAFPQAKAGFDVQFVFYCPVIPIAEIFNGLRHEIL
jgi:hypothetical protein